MADNDDAPAEAAEAVADAAEAAADAAEAAAEAADSGEEAPAAVVVETGGSGAEEVGDALDMAERIRAIAREEAQRVSDDLMGYVDSRLSSTEEAANDAAATAVAAVEIAAEAAEEAATPEPEPESEPEPATDEAPQLSGFCSWWYGRKRERNNA